VDVKYISALYYNTHGREPSLDVLALWLAEREKGATRAKVLAEIAGSAVSESAYLPENGSDYARWVATFDTISNTDRAAIRAHIAGLAFRPLISVILPIGTASEVALQRSLNSVVAQLYPYWELCIIVDAAAEPGVITTIDDWAARDARVKLTHLTTIENIATATNAALQSAIGEFVTFLRAGDKLSETALYEVAFELGAHEGTDIVYSDHDQVAANGQRSDPWFKPGWDPDLLVAHDYIGELVVYRRALVEAVRSLRSGFEEAEFYDLALRATAATSSDRIRHIPAILYHKSQGSPTKQFENALSSLYAISASHRAVREHLDSKGHTKTILQPAPQMPKAIRVIWPLPDEQPLVSVIIPTRDRADLLARCIEGILHRTDYSNLEVLIVDNESAEPATSKLFEQLLCDETRVRILSHPGAFNYSAMNNAAARESKGEVLLLLNNDVDVINPVWLRELVSHAIRPDVGIVGAKLIYANELVQHGGVVLGPDDALHIHRFVGVNDPGYFGQLALPRTLLAVTCACAAVRRAVFFEVGGFDEINLPVTYNDVDFCLRAGDYGYRVVWTPFAELFHLESASRGEDGTEPFKRERALRELAHFRKTWSHLLNSADPFHNPNLLFSWGSFEVPASPRRRKPWRDLGEQILSSRRHFFPHPEPRLAEC
jgi:O-antigen biosynthesis protein